MTKEIYGGRYEVSDDGSIFTNVKYKKKSPLVGKVSASGYRMVVLTVDGKKLYKNVHRLVAETLIPNPDGKREVNHKDGNKLNNSVSNLEWVTTQENQFHLRDVLRTSTRIKLSPEIAQEIKERYANEKTSHRKLAEEYGVKKTIIGQIIQNQRWRRPNHE